MFPSARAKPSWLSDDKESKESTVLLRLLYIDGFMQRMLFRLSEVRPVDESILQRIRNTVAMQLRNYATSHTHQLFPEQSDADVYDGAIVCAPRFMLVWVDPQTGIQSTIENAQHLQMCMEPAVQEQIQRCISGFDRGLHRVHQPVILVTSTDTHCRIITHPVSKPYHTEIERETHHLTFGEHAVLCRFYVRSFMVFDTVVVMSMIDAASFQDCIASIVQQLMGTLRCRKLRVEWLHVTSEEPDRARKSVRLGVVCTNNDCQIPMTLELAYEPLGDGCAADGVTPSIKPIQSSRDFASFQQDVLQHSASQKRYPALHIHIQSAILIQNSPPAEEPNGTLLRAMLPLTELWPNQGHRNNVYLVIDRAREPANDEWGEPLDLVYVNERGLIYRIDLSEKNVGREEKEKNLNALKLLELAALQRKLVGQIPPDLQHEIKRQTWRLYLPTRSLEGYTNSSRAMFNQARISWMVVAICEQDTQVQYTQLMSIDSDGVEFYVNGLNRGSCSNSLIAIDFLCRPVARRVAATAAMADTTASSDGLVPLQTSAESKIVKSTTRSSAFIDATLLDSGNNRQESIVTEGIAAAVHYSKQKKRKKKTKPLVAFTQTRRHRHADARMVPAEHTLASTAHTAPVTAPSVSTSSTHVSDSDTDEPADSTTLPQSQSQKDTHVEASSDVCVDSPLEQQPSHVEEDRSKKESVVSKAKKPRVNRKHQRRLEGRRRHLQQEKTALVDEAAEDAHSSISSNEFEDTPLTQVDSSDQTNAHRASPVSDDATVLHEAPSNATTTVDTTVATTEEYTESDTSSPTASASAESLPASPLPEEDPDSSIDVSPAVCEKPPLADPPTDKATVSIVEATLATASVDNDNRASFVASMDETESSNVDRAENVAQPPPSPTVIVAPNAIVADTAPVNVASAMVATAATATTTTTAAVAAAVVQPPTLPSVWKKIPTIAYPVGGMYVPIPPPPIVPHMPISGRLSVMTVPVPNHPNATIPAPGKLYASTVHNTFIPDTVRDMIDQALLVMRSMSLQIEQLTQANQAWQTMFAQLYATMMFHAPNVMSTVPGLTTEAWQQEIERVRLMQAQFITQAQALGILGTHPPSAVSATPSPTTSSTSSSATEATLSNTGLSYPNANV